MWLFRVTASPPSQKKTTKTKKEEVVGDFDWNAHVQLFLYLSFLKMPKKLQTAYKHGETVAGIRLKRKKRLL